MDSCHKIQTQNANRHRRLAITRSLSMRKHSGSIAFFVRRSAIRRTVGPPDEICSSPARCEQLLVYPRLACCLFAFRRFVRGAGCPVAEMR